MEEKLSSQDMNKRKTYNGSPESHALGACAYRVGRILDVCAGDEFPAGGEDASSYTELGVGAYIQKENFRISSSKFEDTVREKKKKKRKGLCLSKR
jgi:hypothetical protein